MRVSRLLAAAVLLGLLSAGAVRAETKVELKNVHLCCGQCVKIAGNILKKIDGVSGACDQDAKTITITAADDKSAQKAVDALAAGGFHGDTGSKEVTIKDDSGVSAGKVTTLTLTGIHNCCGQCNKAIKATVKKVDWSHERHRQSQEQGQNLHGHG